jgi:multiple sugar transport system substrate-binding protein
MSKLTRRQFGAGIAAAAIASRAGGSPAWAQNAPTGAAALAPLEATRRLPRRYAGQTIKILSGNDPVSAIIGQASNAFAEATGTRLEFTFVNYADRYQKMMLDLTSNTGSFDVFNYAYQWKHEVADHLADLAAIDREIEGCPALDLADYPEKPLAIYGRVGQKLVALPNLGSSTFLIWNKQAYREAGLNPDAAPENWDQVFANAQRLRGGERYGFNQPAGKSIQTACLWMTLFHAFGGKYFSDAGQPQFDNPAAVRAIAFMAEKLQIVSPPGNLTWDFPEMLNSFATGQSTQGFMWPGGFSTILNPTRSVVSQHLGWRGTPGAALLGGWSVGVNARSRVQDAAKLYAAWLTSKEVVLRNAIETGQPCRISAFTDPGLVQRYPHFPAILASLQADIAEYVPIKEAEQINIIIYDEANAACAGMKPPQAAAADMQEKVVRFMRRRGYLR